MVGDGQRGGGDRPTPLSLLLRNLAEQREGLSEPSHQRPLSSRLEDLESYRAELECLPEGNRDGISEILQGIRMMRGWFESGNETIENKGLALKNYTSFLEILSQKITPETHDLSVALFLDQEMAFHSDLIQPDSNPYILIEALEAMPYFTQIGLKVLPAAEIARFVHFNLIMARSFRSLSARQVLPGVREAHAEAGLRIPEAMVETLFEVLASDSDYRRLASATDAIKTIAQTFPKKAEKEVLLAQEKINKARDLIEEMGKEGITRSSLMTMVFITLLTEIPEKVSALLVSYHAGRTLELHQKKGGDPDRNLSPGVMFLFSVVMNENHPALLLAALQGLVPLIDHLPSRTQDPLQDERRRMSLNQVWALANRPSLAEHPDRGVRKALNALALSLLRFQTTSSEGLN